MSVRLAHWWFLFLFVFVPLLALYFRRGKSAPPTLRYSDIKIIGRSPGAARVRFARLPQYLRIAAISLLIIAAARPQFGAEREEITSKGIDIMMVLDQSGSMEAIDLEPGTEKVDPNQNRLAVAKKTIGDFITKRTNDRIGLIRFAGRTYFQCPLTLDYGILLTFIESIELDEKNPMTAIGDAIGMAVLHIKDSDAKSKVVILVTDGESNTGILNPQTAAETAKQFNVKIYTVGVGSRNNAVKIVDDFFGKQVVPAGYGLDDETLGKIADITGGKYFHADNPTAMADIFNRIDEMEKTEIKTNRYTEYSERFRPYAIGALLLLALQVALAAGPLRQTP